MTARVLGVDLGSRRIGIACSDPSRVVASPLVVLQRTRAVSDDHAAILALAREREANVIVVGLPLSLSGRRGPAARAALAEIEQLREVAAGSGIEVVAHDERLTTVTAERSLAEAGVRPSRRRGVVDKVAAAVLLQAWLDGRRG
ncbi:MAG: Holliday junction resolvase RuvX [Actinomycetota bacterium]